MLVAWFLVLGLKFLPLLVQSPAAATTSTTQPAPAPAPANPAAELLATTIANLKSQPAWDTRYEQTMFRPGMNTVIAGRILSGRTDRLARFELKVVHGGFDGATSVVSDGKKVWQINHLPNRAAAGATYDLETLDAAIKKLEDTDLDREKIEALAQELRREHGFDNIVPVLEDVQRHLAFTKLDAVTFERPGQPATVASRLEGEWTKKSRDKFAPPKASDDPKAVDAAALWEKRQGFANFPRRAYLYIDPVRKLPLRLEWYGPRVYEGSDELLTRIDWVSIQPATKEALAQACALTEAEAQIPFQTFDIAANINARRDLLLAAKKREDELNRFKQLDPATNKDSNKP